MASGTQIMKVTTPSKHHTDIGDFPMEGNAQQRFSSSQEDRSPRLPSVYVENSKSNASAQNNANMTSPLGFRDYRDLRVGLPRIHNSVSPRGNDERKVRLPTRSKTFMTSRRTLGPDEQMTTFNPDPVPYRSQIFKDPLSQVRILGSSLSAATQDDLDIGPNNISPSREPTSKRSATMTKKLPHQSRHGQMWRSESDGSIHRMKNYILHTNRYQWNELYGNPDEFTQRGRLQLEREYIDRLKLIRRRREMIPHRETMEFMMGGQQVELNERDDVMQEIRKLKGIILPAAAKDLYVGRGFSKSLPKTHALNKPRNGRVTQNAISSLSSSVNRMADIKTAQPPALTAATPTAQPLTEPATDPPFFPTEPEEKQQMQEENQQHEEQQQQGDNPDIPLESSKPDEVDPQKEGSPDQTPEGANIQSPVEPPGEKETGS